MSSLITNAAIKVRRDTASNWTSNDTTLNQGEWGYETDTGFLKIGDGSTAWTSLAYTFGATSATVSTYSTAWINRSDWTNVHLGTDDTKNADSNLNHALNAPLSDLIVKVFISTDGTDANSFELSTVNTSTIDRGHTIYGIDNNNILVQTGLNGLASVSSIGGWLDIDTEDWYYKIKVYKLA